VLLCTEGSAVLSSPEAGVTLRQGESAFVPAGAAVTASGPAVLYRATTNLG
jgi:mannose-6-phosphate isomerase